MDSTRAQFIDERSKFNYAQGRFKEWLDGSLLFYPLLFIAGAVILVIITRDADSYLLLRANLPRWWYIDTSIAVTISSLVASSMLTLLAIVFSISLVALQLANQQFSPRVISIFERANTSKIALSMFIGTFVYSFVLLLFVLRIHVEEITIISLLITLLLVFTCLVVFVVFMKSIMLMIRVTHIISFIADETHRSIEDNLPPEGAYLECQAVTFGQPDQVILYCNPPNKITSKRHYHGVLKAIEHSTLLQIAEKHNCILRVLPKTGNYIHQNDPVVEVYGAKTLKPEEVLPAIYVDPERSIYQDPAYGIRMLVDIALQALSPAVNAPTTAHQAINRLTNLLLFIAQKPAHTGAYTDGYHQVRLVRPVSSWEDYVQLAFNEIQYYGKGDPHTRASLGDSFEYLLEKVPEAYKPALKEQQALLADNAG